MVSLYLVLAGCSSVESSVQEGFSEPSTDEGALRTGLALTVDGDLYWGDRRTYTVSGALPGETVRFAYSIEGEGPGICPAPLGGLCLDLRSPVSLFATVVADGSGVARGSFTFPDLDLLGFEFSVQAAIARGAGGASSVKTAPLTLPILSRFSPPVAVGDTYGLDEDLPLNVAAPGLLANDYDVDGEPLTLYVIDRPDHGLLTLTGGGGFTYTPAAGYHGPDSFSYQLSDGRFSSEEVTVGLTVRSVNDLPVARPENLEGTEDLVLTVAAPGVLGNDYDLEFDPLQAVVVRPPDFGTLTLGLDGRVTYRPDPDFSGDDSFEYVADDGSDFSDPALVTVRVFPVNDLPIARDDAYSTAEGATLMIDALSGVTANDEDVDGDLLGAVLVSGPSNGLLVLRGDGSFDYRPDVGWSGRDSFTYRADDRTGLSGVATVTVSVGAVADPPTGLADAYEGVEDTVLVVAAPGVLANDTDLDGDALTASLFEAPSSGRVVLQSNGRVTYTPDPNFSGLDTFRYRPFDGALYGEAVEVTIFLREVNDLPVAVDDAYSTPYGRTLVISAPAGLLANDSDVEGAALAPRAGSVLPVGGRVELNLDGSFTYTPKLCFSGVDTFSYSASDGEDLSEEATVRVTVGAPPAEELAFCNAYSPVEPVVPFTEYNFESFPVRQLIPPSPRGLLFAFHGSGGTIGNVTLLEYVEIYNELYARGIGVVVTESTNRADGTWDTSTDSPTANRDFPRLSRLRDHVVATTAIGPSTPILAFGFSNGGQFVSNFTNAAETRGWPLGAFTIHNSSSFGLPDLPGYFSTNVNDDRGTPSAVRSAYNTHRIASGEATALFIAEEEAIHPMLFRKVTGVDHELSQAVFDDLVRLGLIDEDGLRLVPIEDSSYWLNLFERETTVLGPERFRPRIETSWGLHRVNPINKVPEAEFLADGL